MDYLRQERAKKIKRLKGKQTAQTKAKPGLTRNKLMLCVWWDRKDVIHCALIAGQNHQFGSLLPTVETQARCSTKTARIDRKIGCGFHDDNAKPHTSLATQQILRVRGFKSLKNGDYDVEDKDRSGRPKIYEDAELEEDSSQTQKEFALTIEVTQQAVLHRLKSLGIIHKQGVPVKNYLKTLDGEVLPHLPHSPDIAPFNYHLFMAHALSGAAVHII
ncbi:Mariner Mos1 transposase [Eumeta japonica]|uniref:Mariner Mos1 transposase n=1 Tax=Eumeta variegata TaxID=151549 RepID=A0A4C1TIL4_EUMVA|nr:Mariner Mos1 transposase [Eumeta japonica]